MLHVSHTKLQFEFYVTIIMDMTLNNMYITPITLYIFNRYNIMYSGIRYILYYIVEFVQLKYYIDPGSRI